MFNNSIVVSDTSPILNLAKLNKLILLENLNTQILIPNEVFEELTRQNDEVSKNLKKAEFITKITINDENYYNKIVQELDKGESEAITLARELNMPLLIDERRGRRIAKREGLKIMGLTGILKVNLATGYLNLTETQIIINDLINIMDFRVSERLIKQISPKLNKPK